MHKFTNRSAKISQGDGEDRTKVWRRSRLAGTFEGGSGFWRPFDKGDARRYLKAAELFERHTRGPGRPAGLLGHVGIEVLRELLRLVDYRTGRLDPAINTLAARLKRSKGAVVDALRRLRVAGFLDWIRRYLPTGRSGPGPRVEQTSNAYRLALPKLALKLLGTLRQAPPVAADLAAGSAERARQTAVYAFEDTPLGGAFSALENGVRAALAKRESTRRNESPSLNLLEGADEKICGVAAARRPV